MPSARVTKVFKYDPLFGQDQTGDPALEADKAQLFDEFKAYLLENHHMDETTRNRFGRDALYDHPNTPPGVKAASLRHVHILPLSELPIARRKFNQTSDIHLVYCINLLNGHACAIALLKPGHELANNSLFLSSLAEIAEQFFNR